MNNIRYTFLIFAILICSVFPTSAQVNNAQKIKLFKTWISFENKSAPLTGALYEIKDSSIFVSSSKLRPDYLKGNFRTLQVYYKDIDIIRIRRVNSVGTGAILGAAALCIPITSMISKETGGDLLAVYLAFNVGIKSATLGAIAGAAIGSLRGKIAVRGSYEKFIRNRSLLQQYSFIQEPSQRLNILAFKGYAGMVYGVSFPSGTFYKNPENTYNIKTPGTGFGGNFMMGYRFSENFGISLLQFSSWYNLGGTDMQDSWNLGGITTGPVISFPLKNRIFFDIKPGIGFANAFLVTDNDIKQDGYGLGISLNTSLTYNLIGHWCLTTDAGYIFSNVKFSEISRGTIHSANIDIGLAYRFWVTGL